MAKNQDVPVIPISLLWDRTLHIAIRQSLDSETAQQLMENALNSVVEHRACTVIFDILGLEIIDTAVANYLLNIGSAMRLLGCQMIISGISPGIAQTLVQLKVDLGDIRTTATSHEAVEMALRNAGYEVRRIES
ncbi:MAG: STAS domain-containing protein [Pseudomonadales bacterium]|nr:STAS domain-containing protein [Pseudomonadales bacterium]